MAVVVKPNLIDIVETVTEEIEAGANWGTALATSPMSQAALMHEALRIVEVKPTHAPPAAYPAGMILERDRDRFDFFRVGQAGSAPEHIATGSEPTPARRRAPVDKSLLRMLAPPAETVDPLRAVKEAVNRSRWIMEIEPDPDGDGPLPSAPAVWERAMRFVLQVSREYQQRVGTPPPTPHIHPGPNGSIDLEWLHGQRRFYLNVPTDDSPMAYYGDDRGGNTIEGTTTSNSSNYWLLAWLMQ